MSAYNQLLHRYPTAEGFSSGLALDDDPMDLAHGRTSRGVVEQLLRERHAHTATEAKAIAGEITSHVRQGLAFWMQARSGPRCIAFLPYYYGFLQFAKAVIPTRGGPSSAPSMPTHGHS